MKGLVLAGGTGTRLRPLTFKGNKHMIPIANQPILFYGLESLARAGIRDVAIVLGPIQDGIRECVGDGGAFGLSIEYITQNEPRGSAHAVQCAQEFLAEEPFLLYLGDNLLQSGVQQFLRKFEDDRPDAVVGATPVKRAEDYGLIEISKGKIVSIEEKPAAPRSNLALVGVFLLTASIHPLIADLKPSSRGELEITEAIGRLWRAHGRISVLPVEGWWKDTGRPGDLLEANELVLHTLPRESFRLDGVVRPGVRMRGRVGLGPDSVVESGAQIIGPTLIGANARIDCDSVVGPNCAVGNDVVVRRSSVRRSIVMDRSRIEGVSVVDSIVGRNAEVLSSRPEAPIVALMIGDSSRVTL